MVVETVTSSGPISNAKPGQTQQTQSTSLYASPVPPPIPNEDMKVNPSDIPSTPDQYQALRQQAIKTGSFDYSAVKSSQYSPPTTYVNKSGQTVTRQPSGPVQTQSEAEHERQKAISQQKLEEDRRQVQELIKLRSLAPSSIKSGSPEDIRIRQLANQLKEEAYKEGGYQQKASSKIEGLTLSSNVPMTETNEITLGPSETKTASGHFDISQNQLLKTNAYRQYLGLPPILVPGPVQLEPQEKAISISENQLAKTNALRAKEGLEPLQNIVPVSETIYAKGNAVKISEEQLLKTNLLRATEGLPPLEQEVPLLVTSYKTAPQVKISETQLTKTNALRAKEGLPPLEKEVPLLITKYSTQKETRTETESRQTTQNYREDPLSQFFRPILQMGAEIGIPLVNAVTKGEITEPPLFAYLQGKVSNPLQPIFSKGTAEKIEMTFGTGQEAEKITSGEYKGVEVIAPLAGVVASVAIPTVAGASGLGKIPEATTLVSKLTGKSASQVATKVAPSFKEAGLEVHTEKTGKTTELSQGTEQQISLTELKVEKVKPTVLSTASKTEKTIIDLGGGKKVTTEEKVPTGTEKYAIEAKLPKGITQTKQIETVGKVGEKTVAHEPTMEEIADRYPLFGKGHNNDLNDLTKGQTYTTPPETITKPVFGKVIKEVPNVINISEQAAKSGQAEIPFAHITEKQIAYTRAEPSALPESKFTVKNPSEEVKATFGLKPTGGKNEFISPSLTKGSRKYLEFAEKAGLITPKLRETHIQSPTDVLKNPKLYAQATREPKLFEQFPEIVQPQVIGHREAYPMKLPEPKISGTKSTKPFRKMQPFGPIKESKGGAGQAGKATALMKESESFTRRITPELSGFKTKAEPTKLGSFTPQIPRTAEKYETSIETLTYPKGTENKFLTSFKSAQEIISTSLRANKSQVILKEKIETGQKQRQIEGTKLIQKKITDTLTVQKQNDKLRTNLTTKTNQKEETIFVTTPIFTTSQTQETQQKQRQITKQTTKEITTEPPLKTRETNPRVPFGLTGGEKKELPKKIKHGKKNIYNFLGQASEAQVVGLTRRADITYGNKLTAKLTRQDIRKEQRGSFIINPTTKPSKKEAKTFNIYGRITANKRTRITSKPTKLTRTISKSKLKESKRFGNPNFRI